MSAQKQSYGRILRSSSIVGGAQVVTLLIGMVRVKFVAVLLGPTGIGLQGMFMTIRGVASTVSGLGINTSGVRDVASAAGSGDGERIARTVITLRRMCWVTGLVGGLVLAALARPISYLTFQSGEYTLQIASLGLIVLLGSIAAGQMAVIQGMRRIGDLARLNVITTVLGSIIAVGFFWWLGMDGIIPSLISLSVVSLLGSLYYSRRIRIAKISLTWSESFVAAGSLITLGMAFMWSGVLGAFVAYATRALITQEVDLEAVGVFTAAFALSGMFLNFVLGAMGADFYPSLTSISHDHQEMRNLVNQQTEIGMLLAVPGLLATMALAPWIIKVFYTAEFTQAADLLQWFVLGCLGRVISWPMGFIMLAKSRGKLFALTETLTNVVHMALIWLGLKWIGVEGVAMAFCGLYVLHALGMLFVSHHLIGFRWSASVCRLSFILLPIAVFTMIQSRLLSVIPATVIGSLVTAGVGIFCLRCLCERLGQEHKIVRFVGKLPFSRYLLALNV